MNQQTPITINSFKKDEKTKTKPKKKRCIFAAVGDVHGQFAKMIHVIREWENANRETFGSGDDDEDNHNIVNFVLQVGDLEPHRHERDLASMAMPSKHRTMGDFNQVMSGEITVPWPMYFIGGNHEPWEFLEQYNGDGFQLPLPLAVAAATDEEDEDRRRSNNLYFLGRSSVTTIGPSPGLCVAALSGIDSANSYHIPRPHVSLFPTTSNKAYIHFTHTDVMTLTEEVTIQHDEAKRTQQLQQLKSILSTELGMPSRAIESITASSSGNPRGINVQCIADLLTISDKELQAAGVKIGPREKIATYQATVRTKRAQLVPDSNDEEVDNADDGTDNNNNNDTTKNISGEPCSNSTTDSSGGNKTRRICVEDGLVDILMTHDWPSGIAEGRLDERCRPLGNDTCRSLLDTLRPTLMLCGHMHTPYTAVVEPSATTVHCLAKVPAPGSVAFFEVMDDAFEGGGEDHDNDYYARSDEVFLSNNGVSTPHSRRRVIRECGTN